MSKMIASAKVGETLNPQAVALAKLGLTDAEIKQVLADDERINKGEKPYELDPELEKGAKKARQAERKTPITPIKRERKADNDKREIISALDEVLCDICDNVEVKNAEREIVVQYNGRKFKITLSAPRS